MYPEYDAYTYPSKCSHRFIDYSSERRDWERERERESAIGSFFSNVVAADLGAFYSGHSRREGKVYLPFSINSWKSNKDEIHFHTREGGIEAQKGSIFIIFIASRARLDEGIAKRMRRELHPFSLLAPVRAQIYYTDLAKLNVVRRVITRIDACYCVFPSYTWMAFTWLILNLRMTRYKSWPTGRETGFPDFENEKNIVIDPCND